MWGGIVRANSAAPPPGDLGRCKASKFMHITFVFDHIRAAITHRDVLLAGEHAVTLTTPIPDDELLTAELARLDRKIDAVGAPNGAASSTSTRAGSSNSPKRSAAPQKSPPAEKNCSTSEPTSPTNEPRSPAPTSSAAACTTSHVRIHAVIDTLDDTQKQQLLRLHIDVPRPTPDGLSIFGNH